MERIGIYICNYNKEDMVLQCIERALSQNYKDVDVFVVDNASTDASVMRIRNEYGNRVIILQNGENKGGAGGFARAVREALNKKYKYFMLLDNDAFLEKDALYNLYLCMEQNMDAGICGAKILNMQKPEIIQDFGGKIDWGNYNWHGIMGGYRDIKSDVVMTVDYVASCALLARADAVRQFGAFPENNFIYWDDIEWSTKCRQKGYKVLVNGRAIAYHSKALDTPKNLFLRYYANRNRCRFFAKYLQKGQLEHFYNVLTQDIFTRIYCSDYKGMKGTAKTYRNAFCDFIDGKTGMAKEGTIQNYNEGENLLEKFILDQKEIYIIQNAETDISQLYGLLDYIKRLNSSVQIIVSGSNISEEKVHIQLCNHITKIDVNISPNIYVDRFFNYAIGDEAMEYFIDFDNKLEEFRNNHREAFMNTVTKIRQEAFGEEV